MTETSQSSYMDNPRVMDHFMNPRNVGSIDDATVVGTAGNPADGDTVRIYLKIEENTIADAKVKVFGCPVAIAAASALTEMVKGRTIDEALQVRNEDIAASLGGLPEQKLACSVLAEAVLEDAISRYRGEKE